MKTLSKGKIINFISIITTICMFAFAMIFIFDRADDKYIFQTAKRIKYQAR